MTRPEAARLEASLGAPLGRVAADGLCPALDREDGSCRAYAARPLICRLWGATVDLPCPHGCTPPDALSAEAARRLLDAVQDAAGPLSVTTSPPRLAGRIRLVRAGRSR